jgi:hypothetical protein
MRAELDKITKFHWNTFVIILTFIIPNYYLTTFIFVCYVNWEQSD